MTSPDQQAGRSDAWMAAFGRAYRHANEAGEIPCPGCGRSALRLVLVVDSPDSPRTLRGTEQVPDYRLVRE